MERIKNSAFCVVCKMTSLAPLPMTIWAHVSWSKGRNSEGSSRLVAVATGRRGGSVVRGPRWCAAELPHGRVGERAGAGSARPCERPWARCTCRGGGCKLHCSSGRGPAPLRVGRCLHAALCRLACTPPPAVRATVASSSARARR